MRARITGGRAVGWIILMAICLMAAATNAHGQAVPIHKELHPAIDQRITPFAWGMNADQAFAKIEEQIDQTYDARIANVHDPRQQAILEKEREAKKKAAHQRLVELASIAAAGMFAELTPGEYAIGTNESVLTMERAGGGNRYLFFINGKLWKIFERPYLGGPDSEFGSTWQSAVDKMGSALHVKGLVTDSGKPSASYYGTRVAVPRHCLWSDGATQVRLVDFSAGSTMIPPSIGVAYEQIAELAKLSNDRRTAADSASQGPKAERTNAPQGTKPKKK